MKKCRVLLLVAFLIGWTCLGTYARVVRAEEIITEQQFEEKAKAKLSQWLGDGLAYQIIEWAIDAGVLGALFVVYVKYRKYKATSIGDVVELTKKEVGKYLTENFKDLSATSIKEIVETVNELQNSIETIMKVLVLMQDTTTKGKSALLDFLGSKTKSDTIKQATVEVNKELEVEIKQEQEIIENTQKEFNNIF